MIDKLSVVKERCGRCTGTGKVIGMGCIEQICPECNGKSYVEVNRVVFKPSQEEKEEVFIEQPKKKPARKPKEEPEVKIIE